MVQIFLEQIALIGALSVLVLGIFWPHLRTIIISIQKRYFGVYQNRNYDPFEDGQQSSIKHPRLSGHSLHKGPTNRPSVNFLPQNHERYISPSAGSVDGIPALLANQRVPHGLNQSQVTPLPMTLFTASIITLIVYFFMKLLSTKFRRREDNSREINSTNKVGAEQERSLPRLAGRRRFPRLSREERARQLIMQHGGKNVAKALRFLANELENQKLQIYRESLAHECEQHTLQSSECGCSCHSIYLEPKVDHEIFDGHKESRDVDLPDISDMRERVK